MATDQALPSENVRMVIGLAFLGLVGLGGYALVTSSPAGCGSDTGAWVMAQEVVKTRLKSPSTAEFPWFDESFVSTDGECGYVVTGHVDAQNGFGAQVRSRFVVGLEYVPETGGYRVMEVAVQ